jgi:putative oxidoreductase
LLRVACAAAFLYHGSAILLALLMGLVPENFSAFLHAPAIIGYLVGPAILTGVLFRAGAACIINLVIGAIFLVHLSHGFDVGKGGFECAFAQLLAFSVFLSGAGAYSLAGILPPPLPEL